MSARPPPPAATTIAAALAEALPVLVAGDAGCLMPDDLDPDAIALVALLDGTDAPWSWHRDAADPTLVALDRPVLGLVVAAADPGLLATALEHLADAADRALPAAQTLAERLDAPLRTALAVLLRRDLALLAARLPGTRFRPAEPPGEGAAPTRHPDPEGFHAPAVEDHRLLTQRF